MAEIVLIHGIAQEQKSADSLETEWLPALAGGLRVAGFGPLADEVWRNARPGGIESRMVFYGDLFLRPGRMGGDDDLDDLTGEQRDLAEALALEWLRNAAERAPDSEDRDEARAALHEIEGADGAQGLRATARPVLNGLVRIPWFSTAGMGFAQRFVVRSLAQVTRYLTEADLNEQVRERVDAVIGPETKAIIAHSLGSVVAFQTAHRLTTTLPLLLTVGSPLGLRTLVYDRIPEAKTVPTAVGSWWNLADRDDLIAAVPDLARLFADPAGRLHCEWTLDNGSKPHLATSYLSKHQVGSVIGRALDTA